MIRSAVNAIIILFHFVQLINCKVKYISVDVVDLDFVMNVLLSYRQNTIMISQEIVLVVEIMNKEKRC